MSFLWVFAALVVLLGLLAALVMLIPRAFGSKSGSASAPARADDAATTATSAPASETPARPAGWYSDPGHPAFVRWYDGTEWTDRFEPSGHHRNTTGGIQQTR